LGDQIEKNKVGEACSRYEGRSIVYLLLVDKRDGKRPHGRHRRRWEYSIKIDLYDTECGGGGHRLNRSGAG
jgi:hypothetical protein